MTHPTASSSRQSFLDVYEREHQTTRRVLDAYPEDKLDLRPHEKLKNACELAWVFVLERMLGTMIYHDHFADAPPSGDPPPPPDSWDELLTDLEKAHREFGDLIRSASDEELGQTVKFFVGPGQLADIPRIQICWFLLHDQIHHRGQFSVYLRMAGGRVPSIYGPSADEPWM